MSHSLHPLLHNLPIESVYHILDHLKPFDILVSMRNVCSRLDAITDAYQPYTVSIVMTLLAILWILISLRGYPRRREQNLENGARLSSICRRVLTTLTDSQGLFSREPYDAF